MLPHLGVAGAGAIAPARMWTDPKVLAEFMRQVWLHERNRQRKSRLELAEVCNVEFHRGVRC
jgi:hypothetical protein